MGREFVQRAGWPSCSGASASYQRLWNPLCIGTFCIMCCITREGGGIKAASARPDCAEHGSTRGCKRQDQGNDRGRATGSGNRKRFHDTLSSWRTCGTWSWGPWTWWAWEPWSWCCGQPWCSWRERQRRSKECRECGRRAGGWGDRRSPGGRTGKSACCQSG
ncbi:uncharacterized protein BJ171DRAFT_496297 [Polychytrium aggregatum]|uniref:uncharacterized protein n=1 Tax=Polychytrium aggregatum TaxID=110093 RepID=UPI0022FEE801|nr:uncharacterized protein BJ171DRAFT_496297 [Polychytrium aggregatum]KAI9206597.1 hypothetical protein BJ171DRAFT_496297 [Polychytrium aggregatum]